MTSRDRPDPVRATLVAILQQLNRVESMHEGNAHDQTLELSDLERLLHRFWAVEQELVKVPIALGLLVRNGLVEALASGHPVARLRRPTQVRYRITSEGKRFLIGALARSDRIG